MSRNARGTLGLWVTNVARYGSWDVTRVSMGDLFLPRLVDATARPAEPARVPALRERMQ